MIRSLLPLWILVVAACNAQRGSGVHRTESRQVPAFVGIETSGAFTLQVAAGQKQSLELSGDDNLLPLVRTEVHQGILRITTTKSISPTRGMIARVTAPDIRSIHSSGAASIALQGIKNDRLRISLSGAGSVTARGTTGELTLDLSGAGSVKARELRAERVVVTSSGAGNVVVFASRALDVKLSGVGSVSYYGDPPQVTRQVSGLGSITKR